VKKRAYKVGPVDGIWREMGRSADGLTIHHRLEMTGKIFVHAHERDGHFTVELASSWGRRHKRGGAPSLDHAGAWAITAGRQMVNKAVRAANDRAPKKSPPLQLKGVRYIQGNRLVDTHMRWNTRKGSRSQRP
jgi:hypothetical protein